MAGMLYLMTENIKDKVMTQEEKAKAYDEALKVLHKYDGANIMFSQSLKEEMFPELAESDDERIVKELLTFFRESMHGGHILTNKEYDSWIAWLEKQGEQKPWSEEDNINCNRLLYFLDGGNLMQDHKTELFIWVESLKDRYTWKPSDEQMETLKFACGGNYVNLGVLESLYADLKKLKG